MADAPFADLRRRLDALVGRGRAVLRRWALHRALRAAAPWLFPAAAPVPVAYLLASLSARAGGPAWPLPPTATVALAVVVPLAVVAVRTAWLFRARRIDRGLALALYDRELDSRDRLQTADEFLRADARDGFRLAAVADAAGAVERALATELPQPAVALRVLHPGPWPWAAAAVAAFVLAVLLGPGEPVGDAGGLELAAVGAPASLQAQARQAADASVRRETGDRQPPPTERAAAEDSAEPMNPAAPPQPAEPRAQSFSGRAGGTGQEAGRSAADRAASSASGQSPMEPRNRVAEESAPTSSRPPERPPIEPEENDSSSGVASGMGGSSGSRTSESDRETTDRKAERDQDDDDVPDDAEEEEDEEQEAASAMRPLLNQRKAPVNRSLSPSGAGEQQENPDANGRSGPGGLKKTRGVAAMLLGVPMPDQLLGHANPGRMKVQRERAEPQERDSDPFAAEARVAMDESAGAIARDDLTLPMRNLIRDYFLARRQAGAEADFDALAGAAP